MLADNGSRLLPRYLGMGRGCVLRLIEPRAVKHGDDRVTSFMATLRLQSRPIQSSFTSLTMVVEVERCRRQRPCRSRWIRRKGLGTMDVDAHLGPAPREVASGYSRSRNCREHRRNNASASLAVAMMRMSAVIDFALVRRPPPGTTTAVGLPCAGS